VSVAGYLGLLTRRVTCVERSQCYYNVNNLNFCLWTNGLLLTRHEAQKLVNNETILSCHASLTETFSPSWEIFVMQLQSGTCWETAAFGSTFMLQLLLPVFTGSTALR